MSEIIAKVNGINIHKSYLERILSKLLDDYDIYKDLDKFKINEYKTQILERLIDRALLVTYAQDSNIIPDIDDLVKIKQEFNLNDLDINIPLEEQISEELAQDIKMEMIKKKVFEEILIENDDYEYEDKILEEFYENNKYMFNFGKAINVRHIFVSTEELKNNKDYKTKLEKIKNAYELLKQDGDFIKVAKAYSECPSKDSGGDIGIVSKGLLGKEFDDIVFNLSEGEISDIFETEYGLHIAQIIKSYDNYIKPYKQIKNQLIEKIKSERVVYIFENLLNRLRDEAKIEIYSL